MSDFRDGSTAAAIPPSVVPVSPPPREEPPRRRSLPRWLGVAAILVVIALITAGWPVINSWISDRQDLPDGTVLRIGSGTERATVRLSGSGWQVSKSQSDPLRSYDLRHGAVQLTIDYASLLSAKDARNVWAGATRLVEVSGGRVGTVEKTHTRRDVPGQTATLVQQGDLGRLTTYVAPDKMYALQFVELGPTDAPVADRAAAQAVVRDVTFGGHA